jgi:hypothetical protein
MKKGLKEDMVSNYRQNAYKVLIRHERPTIDNIYHQVCLRGNCPLVECTNPGGFRQGRNCYHINAIGELINRILKCTEDG